MLNKKLIQWDWKKTTKLTIGFIILIYAIRFICCLVWAHHSIGMANDMVSLKQQTLKNFHREADKDIERMTHNMSEAMKEMREEGEQFDARMAAVAKDFSESLAAVKKKAADDSKRDFTDDFLESHVDFYDKDLYEADRKAAIEKSGYLLPDYTHYNQLRETAGRCQVALYNKQIENNYRNELAHLQAEHRQREIALIKKPDYLKWPLPPEQEYKIRKYPFKVFFVLLTKEGQCDL